MISSMSLAGILMLLEHPWRLLESGCVISFASIFSIGIILPIAKELWERRSQNRLVAGEFPAESPRRKIIRQAFFANIVISMSITPLLLRFFYQWSPYSI
jgi:competence protein ComEC